MYKLYIYIYIYTTLYYTILYYTILYPCSPTCKSTPGQRGHVEGLAKVCRFLFSVEACVKSESLQTLLWILAALE